MMMNIAKHIIFGFVRNIKRVSHSASELMEKATVGEGDGSNVIASSIRIEKSVEQELEDQF